VPGNGEPEQIEVPRPAVAAMVGVAFQLADLAAAVDAARPLTWRAAWMDHHGKPFNPAERRFTRPAGGAVAELLRSTDCPVMSAPKQRSVRYDGQRGRRPPGSSITRHHGGGKPAARRAGQALVLRQPVRFGQRAYAGLEGAVS